MITGLIKNQTSNGTLVVTLPCSLYDLREHLSSIGIIEEASKLTVSGMENIKVQLEAEEPIGEVVLSNLEQGDLLTDLNMVCQKIRRNCPYGYDEFLDMLVPKKDTAMDRFHFYKQYLPPLSNTYKGVKHLIEEAERYRLTMENYVRACKAAEDEEYKMPEYEDWEH